MPSSGGTLPGSPSRQPAPRHTTSLDTPLTHLLVRTEIFTAPGLPTPPFLQPHPTNTYAATNITPTPPARRRPHPLRLLRAQPLPPGRLLPRHPRPVPAPPLPFGVTPRHRRADGQLALGRRHRAHRRRGAGPRPGVQSGEGPRAAAGYRRDSCATVWMGEGGCDDFWVWAGGHGGVGGWGCCGGGWEGGVEGGGECRGRAGGEFDAPLRAGAERGEDAGDGL